MIVLKNGTVVTGDGSTLLPRASVLVDGYRIVDVVERLEDSVLSQASQIIDCTGKCIMPGMINHHVHGVVFGPVFASGMAPYTNQRVLQLLDRNLLQGQTTICNVDGFATMDEVRETQAAHPVRIKTATSHTPLCVAAADLCDGGGLLAEHRSMTVEKMLKLGAVAIGEIGGGHVLGGGGQDYLYIPKAVKAKTGRVIDTFQARALKLAVLGHFILPDACDMEKVAAALKNASLDDVMTPEEGRQLVMDTTWASVLVTLDSYKECTELAVKYDVPLIIHNAPTSMKTIQEAAKMGANNFIAAHSNYLYTKDEAIENALKLKQNKGVIIDAAVHDPFGAKKLVATPENLFAFFEQDLLDIFSTDFAAGEWDSMLLAIDEVVSRGLTTL
ncbi:MAG: hypothetical protein Q8O07_05070, partial [Chloroflexota bacterium]|nr:hypothetical protein [Chloroflexota bacterium]